MDMWQERGQALDPSWTNSGMGEEEKMKKGGFKKESLREERLHLLSKFLGNRNRGFKRSRRRSSTSRQGLRIETEVADF